MVILPFKRHDLLKKSSLLRAPKGMLLYGPPGCGKTMIAKATAKAAGARFINLQVSSLFDKWYGESQKRAEAVFSLALKIQPTIIFIDEIDSFLRARASHDDETTAMVKTQFMSLWDGLLTDPSCRVMVMGATNRAADLDAAILRRMPCAFNITLPVAKQREQILRVILKDEEVTDMEELLCKLSLQTEGFSGSDLKELCRDAAVWRIREYLASESSSAEDGGTIETGTTHLRSMCQTDFDHAMTKMRQAKCLITGTKVQIDLD